MREPGRRLQRDTVACVLNARRRAPLLCTRCSGAEGALNGPVPTPSSIKLPHVAHPAQPLWSRDHVGSLSKRSSFSVGRIGRFTLVQDGTSEYNLGIAFDQTRVENSYSWVNASLP